MRSFAPVLIAAALATLGSAAPVNLPSTSLPVGVPAALPSQTPSVALPNLDGTTPAPPCLGTIFDTISTETETYTEQLTYLTPSNATINEITDIVNSIKGSIAAAVPQLQALAGQDASVILASGSAVVGDAELTVSQAASIVGCFVNSVLTAAGHVLDITGTESGDVVAEVKSLFTDLGDTVTSLVSATTSLVGGLSAALAPVVQPVESVISDLDLSQLAVLVEVTI